MAKLNHKVCLVLCLISGWNVASLHAARHLDVSWNIIQRSHPACGQPPQPFRWALERQNLDDRPLTHGTTTFTSSLRSVTLNCPDRKQGAGRTRPTAVPSNTKGRTAGGREPLFFNVEPKREEAAML